MKSCDQVTPPHTSDAAALALAANQLFNSVVLPDPSHSTVRSSAVALNAGGTVSSMVKVAVVEELFPQSSLAVKVTTT